MNSRLNINLNEWARFMFAQAKLASKPEMEALADYGAWIAAKTVLEVGVGPGAFLQQLSDAYPEKQYTGIDCNVELLMMADRICRSGNLARHGHRFIRRNFYEPTDERFDAVVFRLFVQHQTDLSAFCRQASALCAPHGTIVVIESNDSQHATSPSLDLLKPFLREVRERQRRKGMLGDNVHQLADAFLALKCQVVAKEELTIEVQSPSERALFCDIFGLAAHLTSNLLDFNFDVDGLREELSEWAKLSNSSAQLGELLWIIQNCKK